MIIYCYVCTSNTYRSCSLINVGGALLPKNPALFSSLFPIGYMREFISFCTLKRLTNLGKLLKLRRKCSHCKFNFAQFLYFVSLRLQNFLFSIRNSLSIIPVENHYKLLQCLYWLLTSLYFLTKRIAFLSLLKRLSDLFT